MSKENGAVKIRQKSKKKLAETLIRLWIEELLNLLHFVSFTIFDIVDAFDTAFDLGPDALSCNILFVLQYFRKHEKL